MIVLDASVLLGHLDPADQHHDQAAALLRRAVDDELAINVLTLAEVLVSPTRQGRTRPVLDFLGALTVRTIGLPPDAAEPLAELRAGTGLKMPDCCVLLTAEAQGARLATFDRRLAAVAVDRGVAVLPA